MKTMEGEGRGRDQGDLDARKQALEGGDREWGAGTQGVDPR